MFICIKCNKSKPLVERTSGRGDYRCKLCVALSTKEWRQKNREKYLAYNKEWNKANLDKTHAAINKWQQEHPIECATISKRYRTKNKELYNKRCADWKRNHPEARKQHKRNRRARILKSKGMFTDKEFQELKRQYGYVCLCCFKSEGLVKLEADHVIPISLGGVNDISNIQPLCKSCNCKKHIDIIDYRSMFAAKEKFLWQ